MNSAKWEHDDTGDISNHSGCVDDINNTQAEHEDWREGYDYQLVDGVPCRKT